MKIFIYIAVFLGTGVLGKSQGATCPAAANLGTPTSTLTCINPTDFSQNSGGMCTGTGMGFSNYWYRFCTNASNNCVSFDINVGATTEWMALLYTDACASMGATAGTFICNLDNGQSTPGTGYFSTAGNDPGVNITTANTCYRLRVQVADVSASQLEICYQTQVPASDACVGAIGIDQTPETYDNACATEGATDPAPAQLCAGSLENTTWYSFTVTNPCGPPCNVAISTNNIDCAGGGEGFQIGYFSGSCGSLTNLGCVNGSGGSVTANLTGATPGATYFVALDGNGGANCYFDISATNTIPQPVELLYFRGLLYDNKKAAVQWSTASEVNASHYAIMRSEDGSNFRIIGSEAANNVGGQTSEYTFDDPDILTNEATYYKIIQYDYDGKSVEYGPIAVGSKPTIEEISVVPNPVDDNAIIYFNASEDGLARIEIADITGRTVLNGPVEVVKGGNSIRFTTTSFSSGVYFGRIIIDGEMNTIKFTK